MKLFRFRNFSTSLQYISDLHLEFSNTYPKLLIKSENLALLGDIGYPNKHPYEEFLKYCSKNFKRVYLISGNHEFWVTKSNTEPLIKKIVSKYDNIEYLNNSKTFLDNYTILGTTLWQKHYSDLHKKSVEFLKSNIIINNPTIILTHYLPSYKLIVPKYLEKEYDGIRDRYATDLEYLMTDNVKVWLCGHSHSEIELYIGNTLCGINAQKYGNNYDIQKNSKIIELS